MKVPDRITIAGLPAYTPGLSPAEHLWPLVKEGVANEPFKDLGDLERRACRIVRRVVADKQM